MARFTETHVNTTNNNTRNNQRVPSNTRFGIRLSPEKEHRRTWKRFIRARYNITPLPNTPAARSPSPPARAVRDNELTKGHFDDEQQQQQPYGSSSPERKRLSDPISDSGSSDSATTSIESTSSTGSRYMPWIMRCRDRFMVGKSAKPKEKCRKEKGKKEGGGKDGAYGGGDGSGDWKDRVGS